MKHFPRERLITIAFVGLALNGCSSAPTQPNPEPLRKLCAAWGGIPLVVPDSRYAPGAVFSIPKDRPIAFIDSPEFLNTCKVPTGLLQPIDSTPWTQHTTDSVDFKAEAALAYQGIAAGPEYSRISSIKMEIPQAMVSGLPIARLNVWYQDNKLSPACEGELKRPDYFIVGEAITVKESKFTAHRTDGAKIKISNATLGDYFKIEPSVGATVVGDGVVTIPQSSTMCVRQLVFNGRFDVLGDAAKPVEMTPAARSLLEHYAKQTASSRE